ncbi:MAG: peptide chain release factor N(5)-glutamine methyltransferase [Flavobacteriales bacterium]|nr:peptide chain release factor N(5)-glutamine methyltransferase [Flavobacteriales bacterium]
MNEQGLNGNKVDDVRRYMNSKLIPIYGEREAFQISIMIFQHVMNWSKTDLIMKKNDRLTESEILKLHFPTKEIAAGKPVQYVLGSAYFCGFDFEVNENVLIPRPETEELVRWVVLENTIINPIVLDFGTGSGCIAISLKKMIPQAAVKGVELSEEALNVAKRNAIKLNCEVEFVQSDMRQFLFECPADIIVSNPPYIGISESSEMNSNVVNHEPHIALFVPDEDPLLYYKVLHGLALKNLKSGGMIALECHEVYAGAVRDMFLSSGFSNVQLREDMQGKPRMVIALRD